MSFVCLTREKVLKTDLWGMEMEVEGEEEEIKIQFSFFLLLLCWRHELLLHAPKQTAKINLSQQIERLQGLSRL
jgi:hypothetical protein